MYFRLYPSQTLQTESSTWARTDLGKEHVHLPLCSLTWRIPLGPRLTWIGHPNAPSFAIQVSRPGYSSARLCDITVKPRSVLCPWIFTRGGASTCPTPAIDMVVMVPRIIRPQSNIFRPRSIRPQIKIFRFVVCGQARGRGTGAESASRPSKCRESGRASVKLTWCSNPGPERRIDSHLKPRNSPS